MEIEMAKNVLQGRIEDSLQALAFWVGYQNQQYRHHSLPEGAIVAELTRLISGKTGPDFKIECEVLYSKLATENTWDKKALADIVISETDANWRDTLALLEIKKAKRAASLVENDLIKIAHYKKISPKTRTYLVVVSQGNRPEDWVDANGKSRKGTHTISLASKEINQVKYRVVRVLKAAASFESKGSAHYCCLLEVL